MRLIILLFWVTIFSIKSYAQPLGVSVVETKEFDDSLVELYHFWEKKEPDNFVHFKPKASLKIFRVNYLNLTNLETFSWRDSSFISCMKEDYDGKLLYTSYLIDTSDATVHITNCKLR